MLEYQRQGVLIAQTLLKTVDAKFFYATQHFAFEKIYVRAETLIRARPKGLAIKMSAALQ